MLSKRTTVPKIGHRIGTDIETVEIGVPEAIATEIETESVKESARGKGNARGIGIESVSNANVRENEIDIGKEIDARRSRICRPSRTRRKCTNGDDWSAR